MPQTEALNPAMQNISAARYHTVGIDGLQIFYREGGTQNKETILFLHGFPSSSHMYRDVMARLSANYHVVAPDYPGFGQSSCPPADAFSYTFDQIALVMERFVDALNLERINLYMQDYGGPVGFRIAAKRPELIRSLLIQNANAYLEGLGPEVQMIGKLQEDNDAAGLKAAISYMLSYEGNKAQYLHGVADSTRVSPDAYNMDSYFLERDGAKAIQTALFNNYGSNFSKYSDWQAYFRKHQPPTLIVWGKHDRIFTLAGANAYKQDLKNAELHILDGGHFALEEYDAEIAGLIHQFLTKLAAGQ